MPKTTHNGKKKIGRLYGVGVGPGDPELLTLRAYNLLSRIPIIFIPLKDEKSTSYARSVIKNLVKESEGKVIGVVLPMLRDKEQLTDYWLKAAESIWQYINKGQDCAFINIGDPLLYGTFIHILETLKKSHPEIEVEVIPGISSISAAAARTVVPLASNDERIAIISGNRADKVIREALDNFDTVVFIKMNKVFDRLLAILEELNLIEKCVYVKRCTTQDEEIIRDISKLKGKKVDYFSLLIVRK
ncbi:MAG: precorrin-2 C(20)-methyltransferase [Chloroflexi bacterium RBG_13_48_17]|nr:MAG: precorrin-2 C(20)-methyltransferase [Chloroflexi bacterium RBG_13_48_17]